MRVTIRYKILFAALIVMSFLALNSYNIIREIFNVVNEIGDSTLDKTELIITLQNQADKIFIYTVCIFIGGVIAAFLVAYYIQKPIKSTLTTLNKLKNGEMPDVSSLKMSNDEIGDMQRGLTEVIEGLKSTAQFAVKIGKGELDADFKPISDQDVLGHALLDMRSNLQTSFMRDEERNKIVLCNSEVGNILRSHNQLDALGDDLLKYLCIKISAIQGAFYIVEGEGKDKYIKLTNTFAYNKKKTIKKEFKFAEGLVGQAVVEMDMVHRTEIPRDYVTITSGLIGEQRPTSILIMPLITNEKVYGALEFASIYKLKPLEIDIIKNVSEIIAQTIFNLQVNERTAKLLQESQRMSSELKEQSAVLQQNAEEMHATQEELQRSNKKLEEQIEEVNKSQNRTHALLVNASEVIIICDKVGKITYVSPSIQTILGYSTEELIGTKYVDKINKESKSAFTDMFENVLVKPKQIRTLQYVYHKKDGSDIWIEVSCKNLITDKAIQGIVLNKRDITERRLAEKEARMRSQMQSLSENSPDLITRLNKDGDIYYINPTIEQLTGNKPDIFLRKNVTETSLNDGVVKTWQEIIHQVITQKNKIQLEMTFPSLTDSLVMNVNAIPEYNDDKSIESVLLVSNDITERKKAELEIQSKNKKITESINYAQRIQVAILPELNYIKTLLPDFFMLYKPRDVVSGDFPWFVHDGDNIYIAAVDCTGHGVPGAMLSLIGYFLLNDIVKSQKVSEPGRILDLLDHSVTKTLKQDTEGNEMKDGMDIALCKINLKQKVLEYAGAHRPLYQMRGTELLEYKGDKFPIGGGIFRNQTDFTNYKIDILQGDSFFFCSDGYPDQFGGPDDKKIGPARIKNIIMENNNIKHFDKMKDIFDQFYVDWKGNTKQMDDVLLIGIKL
ncbi:MAG: PAS domain S-box protein [Cytophagales bacterium]|nr:PAS domain S-box protein [Cytophagales bacterium]